jgi:hypothetical protein
LGELQTSYADIAREAQLWFAKQSRADWSKDLYGFAEYCVVVVGDPGIEPGVRLREGVTVPCHTLRPVAHWRCQYLWLWCASTFNWVVFA